MRTIAVFGGTFNPFHIGHEQILSSVCDLDFVDEVFIIPSKIPPHKSVDFLADDESRLEMCKIVARRFCKASVCDIEINRDGKSYTIETLQELHDKYNDTKFYLVIGGDMLTSFTEWKDYRDILKLAGIIVFSRTTTDEEAFNDSIENLHTIGAEIKVIDREIKNVSSTEIRDNLCNFEFLHRNLPKEVLDYILSSNIYGDKVVIAKYQYLLSNMLDDYRYKHSLCVSAEAVKLAEIYGADIESARVAGLLHDITKNYSKEEHLKIFDSFDIILSDIEKNSEKLWHAISGSVFVRNILKIENDEIISAIRYHTTGKRNMSLLEKIIYVADFTSADRNYPDVEVMRRLSRTSLDEAIIYALRYTINELTKKGATIHPDTVSAYNYLTNKKGEIKN